MTGQLKVEGLTVKRGDLTVCRNVSLEVPAGKITVLVGPNGAGKTTLLDGITGLAPISGGSIILDGEPINAIPAYRRAGLGLGYVEQGRSIFTRLTVTQNLAVVDSSRETLDRAFELFPLLADKRHLAAGLLSGGEQQMLIIARALATAPRFLLVDELSQGLAPQVVSSLGQTLVELAQSGLGILLVEQFVELAFTLGTFGHVMHRGQIIRSGTSSELLKSRDSLVSSYSGEESS